jgi:hypothetical protein
MRTQVLEVRHGAVVGVAELLPALKAAGIELPVEQQAKVHVRLRLSTSERTKVFC